MATSARRGALNWPSPATTTHSPHDTLEILEQVDATHAYRHVALRHFGASLYDSVLLFSDRQSFE